MGPHTLDGLTVMVTRPPPEGDELCSKIRAAGGLTVYFPTIAIQPPQDIARLSQQIAELALFDWLIFISPQAVYQAAPLIHAQWPVLPKNWHLAAVGGSTALALEKHKFPKAVYPEDNWSSEGLLDLPLFQQLTGKKIALITGEDGRPLLATELQARGAKVLTVPVYQRVPSTADVLPITEQLHARKINIIVCTSNGIIKQLQILLGQRAWYDVCQLPMLVISERMQLFAQQQGIQRIFLAKNASLSAIMTALLQKDYVCQKINGPL